MKITCKDVEEYLKIEYYSEIKRTKESNFLTDEGKEEEGLIIRNLIFITTINDVHTFEFKLNNSKYKSGDYAILRIAESIDYNDITVSTQYKVIITEITKTEVKLKPRDFSYTSFSKSDKFYVIEPDIFDLPLRIIDGISIQLNDNLNSFTKIINNNLHPAKCTTDDTTEQIRKTFIKNIEKVNPKPKGSQKDAIISALQQPEILAIQGPPGTGKTRVLAITGMIFSRLGYEVIILSNSHSAVNNALNAIFNLDDKIEIIKIGKEIKNNGLKTVIRQFDKFSSYRNHFLCKKSNNIIGLTIYSAILSLVKPPNDVKRIILIDESSQIPLTLGLFTGYFGATSLIFYGDPQQMPPIFDDELKNHYLSESIISFIQRKFPDNFIKLKETYRLNGYLTEVIGQVFYSENDNQKSFLKSARKENIFPFNIKTKDERLNKILAPNHSLVWIQSPKNFSRQVNNFEAKLVAKIVKACFDSGMKTDDFVVVTPYRRQINAITIEIKNEIQVISELPIVDTVEKVQGQSKELVIISYTTSDPDYLGDVGKFLYSANRLNVTLSRAKTKVIFICSNVILESIPPGYNDLEAYFKLKKLYEKAQLVVEYKEVDINI